MALMQVTGSELRRLFPDIEQDAALVFTKGAGGGAIAAGPDAFDSQMLHLPIARVYAIRAASSDEFSELYQATALRLREDGFVQLVRRVNAADYQEIWSLERSNFELTDVGVTFSRRIDGPLAASLHDDLVVRPATLSDVEYFASTMFCEPWTSRYDADPMYRPQNVRELRAQWLRNCLQGRAAVFLVGEIQGRPAGLVIGLLDRSQSVGQVELVATLPEFRGRRVAARVLDHVVAWFSKVVRQVTVRTQVINIAAANLYEKAGFLLHHSDLTYRQNLLDFSGE
jgi:ribosomal protein S18 acetylase RimI-like enzyme